MPIPAIRVKQTTNTTGTGTLTLNAASADFRSWATGFGGSSVKVRYILSRSGVYEEGYGTFNGSTTLTRDTVIASSNAGSLVSLAAGSTDVFFDFLPGDRQSHVVTGSATLALADIGNVVRCTPSAAMTLTLPAVATVPPGMGFLIKNSGTNNAVVSIDPNASETLEGSALPFPLFVGEAIEVISTGTAWVSGARPTGMRFVGRSSASISTSIDFVLPHYISALRSSYIVKVRNCRLSDDGATLYVRTSTDAGASFAAGASDYTTGYGVVTGVSTWAGGSLTSGGIAISSDANNSSTAAHIFGTLDIVPGAAGVRNPGVIGMFFTEGNGGSYAGPQPQITGGVRNAAQDINAIRFLAGTGTISLGDFDLFAIFD